VSSDHPVALPVPGRDPVRHRSRRDFPEPQERFLGNLDGQIFVFFILTVAAAEAAIGLAILVVLFRERRSINVDDLDVMKG
jgi:hypothetical protein